MTFKVGEGVAGIAVQQGRTFLTDDYLADARFPHIEQSDELVERTGYVSVLAAPMRGEHGSLGSISVSSHRTGAYDEASAQLLQALADQAAITIQNARLIAELNRSRTQLRRRAEEEQSLREIAARISATKGARDVLQRTVDEAARLLAADESRIDLIDADSGLLKWAYHSSASTPYGSWEWPDNPDEKIEQGISGLAVLEARVAWTGDYLNDPGFLHASSSDQYVKEIGINSVMSAPLLDAGRVFGALTIYTRRSEAWGTDDARLIEAIANQAAIAISTARLIEELDRSSAELARRAEAQQSLLEIAARITAIRDPGRSSSRSSTRPSGSSPATARSSTSSTPARTSSAGPTTRGSARSSPPRPAPADDPGRGGGERHRRRRGPGDRRRRPPRRAVPGVGHQRPLLRGDRLPVDDHRPDQRGVGPARRARGLLDRGRRVRRRRRRGHPLARRTRPRSRSRTPG